MTEIPQKLGNEHHQNSEELGRPSFEQWLTQVDCPELYSKQGVKVVPRLVLLLVPDFVAEIVTTQKVLTKITKDLSSSLTKYDVKDLQEDSLKKLHEYVKPPRFEAKVRAGTFFSYQDAQRIYDLMPDYERSLSQHIDTHKFGATRAAKAARALRRTLEDEEH